jgi:hypothetical protein
MVACDDIEMRRYALRKAYIAAMQWLRCDAATYEHAHKNLPSAQVYFALLHERDEARSALLDIVDQMTALRSA